MTMNPAETHTPGKLPQFDQAAVKAQYMDLMITIQDAWGTIHQCAEDDLKARWSAILRENSDFAEIPPVISTALNARLYQALDDGKALFVKNLMLSNSLRSRYIRVLEEHATLASPQALPDNWRMMLKPSGQFITDNQERKVAEMLQPGDSPAEQEAIKHRIVGAFNALPALVGVLLRADKEGALWQALYNEGISDAYDAALSDAVKSLGADGIAMVAHLYELDPESIRAKVEG